MHPNHANQQIKPKFVFEARKNILVKVHADYVFENSSFFAQDEIRDRTAKMAVSIWYPVEEVQLIWDLTRFLN